MPSCSVPWLLPLAAARALSLMVKIRCNDTLPRPDVA